MAFSGLWINNWNFEHLYKQFSKCLILWSIGFFSKLCWFVMVFQCIHKDFTGAEKLHPKADSDTETVTQLTIAKWFVLSPLLGLQCWALCCEGGDKEKRLGCLGGTRESLEGLWGDEETRDLMWSLGNGSLCQVRHKRSAAGAQHSTSDYSETLCCILNIR